MGKCHYRRHLRGAKLSIYEFSLALASKTPAKILTASNATLMGATTYSRDTVIEVKKALVDEGWWIQVSDNRQYAKLGMEFKPNEFRVLDHNEWAQKHPGQCGLKLPMRKKSNAEKSAIPDAENSHFSDADFSRRNSRKEPDSKKQERETVGVFADGSIRSFDDFDEITQKLYFSLEERLARCGFELWAVPHTPKHNREDCICGRDQKELIPCGCDP